MKLGSKEKINLKQFRKINSWAAVAASVIVYIAYFIESSKYSDSDNVGMVIVTLVVAVFYAPMTCLLLSFLHAIFVKANYEDENSGFFLILYRGMPMLLRIPCLIGILIGIPSLIWARDIFIMILIFPFTGG